MQKFYLLILFVFFSLSLNAQNLSFNYKQPTSGQFLCSASKNSAVSSSSMYAAGHTGGRIEQKPSGFYGIASAGGGYAFLAKDNTSLVGGEFIGGYRWSLYSGVGIGIGIYKETEDLHSNIPVFIELRNHFTRNRFSPFSTISAGYAIQNGRASAPYIQQAGVVQGGPLIGVSFGLRYLFTPKNGIIIYAGYMGQKETIEEHVPLSKDKTASIETPYFLHQIKFGLGVTF